MTSRTKRRALATLVPVVCALAFTQCGDFLETNPFGALNTGTYYKSAKDFESAFVRFLHERGH